MPPQVGSHLKKYLIVRQLSSGGMGAVFLAEDTKLNRKVALKVLPEQWKAANDQLARFQQEARVLATLSHPNIVTIYSVEQEEDVHFLTMELVEGKTLAEVIPSVGLSAEDLLGIATPLADALSAAHHKGIIHRDLKPANIMVGDDGRVKILDFGLAKRHEAERHLDVSGQPETQDGQMMGTLPYMSPEQVHGDSIDPRTDIFSLGIILYEMATGGRPFQGKSWGDVASAVLRDNPPSVTDINILQPRQLGRIIRHCLEKDPDRRFQTALDLRNELEELSKELVVEENRSGSATRDSLVVTPVPSVPDPRATERRLAVLATIFVTLAMAGLVWLRTRDPDSVGAFQGKRIAVLLLENLGSPEDAYFAAGITEEITSRLASVRALQVISRTTVLHYDRAGKTAREIGEDLSVDYLLEGTVRWSGGANLASASPSRVRVTPRLIRVADDSQVWSQPYDRVIEDIFAVQSEIAEQVIVQMDIVLGEPERLALASRPTSSLDAYHAYLRGMDHASRRSPNRENWILAAQMFQDAVDLDPRFALAYAELSEVHSLMYHYVIDPSESRVQQARAAADRALEINAGLPEGHRALGYFYYWVHGDYEKALEEFAVAARDLPNDSQLFEGIGYIRRRQGRFEDAVVELEKALQLNPRSSWLAAELAQTYTRIRRYEDADRFYRRSIALAPDEPVTYQGRALNFLLWRGDTNEAREVLESMPEQQETGSLLAWYRVEMLDGNYSAALEKARGISAAVVGIDSASLATQYLRALALEKLGDSEGAREGFERALRQLELESQRRPGDPRVHCSLGLVYASLGRTQEASEQARRTMEHYVVRRDALNGPLFAEQVAAIYARIGDFDQAFEQLDLVLSVPSELSPAMLRLDPRWATLRQDPRFERLAIANES